MESHEGADGGQTKQNISISTGSQESLATCDASVKLQAPSNHPPAGKDDSRDFKNTEEQDTNSKKRTAGEHSLETFDWKDFETRYTSAMSKMNELEAALHKEFGELMSYFSIWATAPLLYDEDRALKRIKTREAFVQHKEQSLEERKNHYIQVVTAFKSALALLGGP